MTPEKLAKIRDLFEAALLLPVDGREPYLVRECGTEQDVIDAVKILLVQADSHTETMIGRVRLRLPQAPATGSETRHLDQAISHPLPVLSTSRYILRHELGRGGFGSVYLAADQELVSRVVVVKVLHAASPDSWQRKKFRNELEALSRLNHPSIVAVLDSGQTIDGRPFLVMEYIDGVSLRTLIRPQGVTLDALADIMRQIGSALDYAHQKGVWHRDLKPENIILQALGDGETHVGLIDFGIATVRSSEQPLTTSTRVAGTYRYMAPEQLQGKPSAASDIYSLGVIAYEMVTGSLPFNASSAVELYAMQINATPAAPRTLRQNLPAELDRVIMQALAFDQQKRPVSVREFSHNLVAAARAPHRAGHWPHTAEPHVGKLAPKMCNRRSQEDEFKSFLFRCKRQPCCLPAICLVHGEEGECHESLVERLTYAADLILRKRTDDETVAARLVKVPWQYDGPVEIRLERLVAWLVERLSLASGQSFDLTTAETFGAILSASAASCIVLQHDIRATRWDGATKAFIRSYKAFLSTIRRESATPQLIVFFNVIYPHLNQGWALKQVVQGALLAPSRKRRIQSELLDVLQTSRSVAAGECPCLLLDELRPITHEDVMEWFSLHNILESEEQRLKAAIAIFGSGTGDSFRSMAEIETHLTAIQRAFLLERGYL